MEERGGEGVVGRMLTIDLVKEGHRLILFTIRSNKQKDIHTKSGKIKQLETNILQDAINWFKERDIPLWGINENPEQKSWSSSPKPYCHLYIDDAALGVPLAYDADGKHSPYVDWSKVRLLLQEKGYLPVVEESESNAELIGGELE